MADTFGLKIGLEGEKEFKKALTEIKPFTCLLNDGVISEEDYAKIKTILTKKYRPIFVGYIPQIQLDNSSIQR